MIGLACISVRSARAVTRPAPLSLMGANPLSMPAGLFPTSKTRPAPLFE